MGERQYGKYLADIRSDHVERYEQAAKRVIGEVLDVACGCGYGSYVLCLKNNNVRVTGADISEEAIQYAKMHWRHHRNKFLRWDLNSVAPKQKYDWLVCFETIEHLEDPKTFLKAASKVCNRIICSVPNQDVIPFDPKRFDFHYRHYTPVEIMDLLHECGFCVSDVKYQRTAYAEGYNRDTGRTIIIEGASSEACN